MFIRLMLSLLLSLFSFTSMAKADVRAVIDKSEQTMTIYQDGDVIYQWLVSTGKEGRSTPTGTFRVQSMDADHYSSRYGNAPMPWSVFFNRHIATHGTTDLKNLGKVASHGCVRLHPDNARILYKMIQEHGRANTTIIVQD